MNTVILSEFATPILLSRWEQGAKNVDMLVEFLTEELKREVDSSEIRGQEQVGIQTAIDSTTGIGAINLIYRAKFETNDRIHLEVNSQLRDLLLWVLDQTKNLMAAISVGSDNYRPYVLNCWASLYKEGHYHNAHIHPGSLFSAVYCVSKPKLTQGEGALVLFDPRPNINYVNFEWPAWANEARVFDLMPGDLIVFPGWLKHAVTPFRGPGERLTIAVNMEAKLPH